MTFILLTASIGPGACKRKEPIQIAPDFSKRYLADIRNIYPVTDLVADLLGPQYNLLNEGLAFIDTDVSASGIFLLCTSHESTIVAVLDTGGTLRETFPFALPKNATPRYLFSGKDGNLFVFYDIQGAGPWDVCFEGMALNTISGETRPIDLSGLGSSVICDIECNGSDAFAIVTEDALFLTDISGSVIRKADIPKKDSFYESVAFFGEDKIMALFTDSSSTLFLQTVSTQSLKTIKQEIINGLLGTECFSARLITSTYMAPDTCFIETEIGIYGLSDEGKFYSKRFDKIFYDFFPATDFVFGENGTLITIGQADQSKSNQAGLETSLRNFGLFTISLSEDTRPTITIRVGICLQGTADGANVYLLEFQRLHPEYVFEIIDYNAPQTTGNDQKNQPIDLMYADLISNRSPDILLIDPSVYEQIDSSDSLMDLNLLIESDESFDPGNLIQNIWKAGQIDGARYFISPFFGLNGMYAQVSTAEAAEGKTLDEFGSCLQGMGEKPYIVRENTPEKVADLLFEFHLRELINQSENGLRFDVDRLRSILSFSQRFGTQDEYESLSVQEQFSEGMILFLDKRLRDYHTFLYDMEHTVGPDVTYISAPGLSENEPVIFSNMFISIPLSSKQPDAAWEFVEFILSPAIQDRFEDSDLSFGCMPILLSSFEQMLERNYENYLKGSSPSVSEIMKADNLTDPSLPDFSSGPPIPQNPLPKDETTDSFRKLVYSAHYYQLHSDRVYRIISEELTPVFSGHKSLDAAVMIIEDRVKTYLQEDG